MKPTNIDKIRGCLAGVAIGDALGMPVETMTPEDIRAATGGQGVRGFLKPIQKRLRDTLDLEAGATTDDTQLTFAVARSLIECRTFVVEHQGTELVREFETSRFGWGRATTEAAKAIGEWRDWMIGRTHVRGGRAPELPAPPPKKPGASCGNGVAMKVAPLALFRAVRDDGAIEPLMSEVMSLGLMTHGDPRASFAAVAMAALFTDLVLSDERLDGGKLLNLARGRVMKWVEAAEFRYQFFRKDPDTLSARLATMFGSLRDLRLLRSRVGTGCFAPESVPFAIGVFLRHPADFRRGVLEAVNSGGDTDTTGSMVGALIGANIGLAGIPAEWQTIPSVKKALELADQLIEAAKP